MYSGYCDGIREALAVHGVQVRLTPDGNRRWPAEPELGRTGTALTGEPA